MITVIKVWTAVLYFSNPITHSEGLDINIQIRKIKISTNITLIGMRNWHACSVEKHLHGLSGGRKRFPIYCWLINVFFKLIIIRTSVEEHDRPSGGRKRLLFIGKISSKLNT